jgi:uncharacterized metal-binding protein YceD (DUF177 family)
LKVVLRRVTKTPLDFEVRSGEIIFKGYLEYYKGKLILLKAKLNGFVLKPCDSCAEEFKLPINETVEFFISDGIYEDDDSIDLDVVESFDGNADIEELLHSEMELIKSDYHRCESCESSE